MAMLGYGIVGSGAAEFLGSNKYNAKNADDLDVGMQYEDALKAAQELGFAEDDQSGEVLGLDWARKLSILSPKAFRNAKDMDCIDGESSWLLRVRSGSRIEVMKKLAQAFSICSIMAGEFGAEGDEVAAFVKAKNGSQIDICMDDLKNSLELKGFKKIMLLED